MVYTAAAMVVAVVSVPAIYNINKEEEEEEEEVNTD